MATTALVCVGLAAGLALDEGLHPPWLNMVIVGTCLTVGAVALALSPRPWTPVITVDEVGLEMPTHLKRKVQWAEIISCVALRNDAADGSPGSWDLWIWISGADALAARSTHRDGSAIQIPLRIIRRAAPGEPRGEDVLAAIESYRPVERRAPHRESEIKLAERQSDSRNRPARAHGPRTVLYPGRGAYVMAGIIGVPLAAIATGMILRIEGFGDFDPAWLPRAIGIAIFALIVYFSWLSGLYPRRPQITVGPEGLLVHERHSKQIPWTSIRLIELVFDSSPMTEAGGSVGWLMRVHVDEPERWLSKRELRSLGKDGAFAITVDNLTDGRKGSQCEQVVTEAIEPFTPVIIRRT